MSQGATTLLSCARDTSTSFQWPMKMVRVYVQRHEPLPMYEVCVMSLGHDGEELNDRTVDL